MRDVKMKNILAVERAVDILLAFSAEKPAMTTQEISEITEIPSSTVYRILCTLENKNMVQFDEKTQEYKPGLNLFKLSSYMPFVLDVRQEAEELLDQLHNKTGQTVVMAVNDADKILYVYKKEKEGEGLKFASVVGQRRPYQYGVLGPLLLAFQSEKQIERILNSSSEANLSNYPIITNETIKKNIPKIKREKIFVEVNNTSGVAGISAPIFNVTGEVIAAFGVIGPSIQLEKALFEVITLVKETSVSISKKLGYSH